MKNNDYYCPKCNKPLIVEDHIILSAKTKGGELGLILLKPELGDYEIKKHNTLKIEVGEPIEFSCPLCNQNLKNRDNNLAELVMIDPNAEKFIIQFSDILGEQATYKVQNGKLKEKYGNDNKKYLQ
ncbi:MAG: hypothetical protein U9N85_03710 [Bacteroidota bacterium]|nr:hypothetical protein [Bacteroidota bacterium]